jgi:hypothetical protein
MACDQLFQARVADAIIHAYNSNIIGDDPQCSSDPSEKFFKKNLFFVNEYY